MNSISDHLSSRRLTVNTAAKNAGLSVERFQAVASGSEATLSEMRGIAKALRVPLSTLVDDAPAEPIKVLFRQTLGQREFKVSTSVDVISEQIRDTLIIAEGLPKNTSWLDLFRGIKPTLEAAEGFAELFRKAFGQLDDQEPFDHLPRVAHELGIYLLYCRDSSVEGVSAIVAERAMILLGPRNFKPRMLFTIAHEVGHLVAHHDKRDDGYAMLDREADFNGIPKSSNREEEKFADAFASSLVLPRHGVLVAVKAIREQLKATGPLGDIEILWLAHLFNVSFEVAARRCEQLQLLPPRGARALYQRLMDDFTNPERRAEELGIPKRGEIEMDVSPSLLLAAVQKVRSGNLSIGRAAELLNVPVSKLFVANTESAV